MLDHLINHLRDRSDVQNIDLMNLSGFCRNCLSKWYVKYAKEENYDLDYERNQERLFMEWLTLNGKVNINQRQQKNK